MKGACIFSIIINGLALMLPPSDTYPVLDLACAIAFAVSVMAFIWILAEEAEEE